MALLLVGCATLTPEQSAWMKDGQRFADEVTTAYNSPRVEVVVNRNNALYTGYWPNQSWISLQPTDMTGDPRLKLVPYLSNGDDPETDTIGRVS